MRHQWPAFILVFVFGFWGGIVIGAWREGELEKQLACAERDKALLHAKLDESRAELDKARDFIAIQDRFLAQMRGDPTPGDYIRFTPPTGTETRGTLERVERPK